MRRSRRNRPEKPAWELCCVTYADDLVILCRKGSAENALHHLHQIMGKLKLTVNEEKTPICRVPDGEFDFLGTLRSLSSARISRRFSGFCRLCERMYSHILLTTWPRGSGPEPTTAASSLDGCSGFCRGFALPELSPNFGDGLKDQAAA
jgi:hypothetical protein